jgi:hypothetical protein
MDNSASYRVVAILKQNGWSTGRKVKGKTIWVRNETNPMNESDIDILTDDEGPTTIPFARSLKI